MKRHPYTFAENPSDDSMGGIRITGGKYKGLSYQYGVVSFDGLPKTTKIGRLWQWITTVLFKSRTPPRVNFTYHVFHNPNGLPINSEVESMMGDILMELLEERYQGGIEA
jgi:hypothetical protein